MKPFPFSDIIAWYEKYGRHDLPWRDYDYEEQQLIYRVWISEIMLQQTQVDRVRKYFERTLEAFSTLQDLAKADWDAFFPYYDGLGYYRRGQNMLKLAKTVINEYIWKFPTNPEDLQLLPGIGPYTSRSICAFALDQPVLSFDTNLEKIFSRYYFGSKHTKLTKLMKLEIQEMFEETWISWRDINNALMDFGALVSLKNPDKIDWDDYPLKGCEFAKTKGGEENSKFKIQNSKWKTGKFWTLNSELWIRKKTKDLEILVYLHRDHKIYFSPNPDQHKPFRLGKHDGDHRAYIKDWFTKKYDLTLSVRPPFEKTDSAVKYHAQMQKGVYEGFGEFTQPTQPRL